MSTERQKEQRKAWRKNNPEKCRAYSKKWRDNNPEKHLESQIRWREANITYGREHALRWKMDNREQYNETQKEYNRQHSLTINGKRVRLNKRPRPNACEVCGIVVDRLDYHHWDDEHPCLGLWLCLSCHKMAERIDKGLHITYLREKHGMVLVMPSVP